MIWRARLAALAGLAIILLFFSPQSRAETLLERGTYLMRGIVACGNCHTPQGPNGPLPGMELAGGLKFDEPPFTAYGSNITPDPETGIGAWTDAQIVVAIREGKRPDGSIIGPPMPIGLYRGMSDRDAQAIVAYLRALPPVRNMVPKSDYRIPLPTSYGPPLGAVPEVSRDDKLTYGAYLAGPLGHCVECHTPFVNGRPDLENSLGAGGFEMHGPWGTSIAANITPDSDTGLGSWSAADIKRAITQGVRPDGARLAPPMAFSYYATMSEADLDAIVTFLGALRPIRNAVR